MATSLAQAVNQGIACLRVLIHGVNGRHAPAELNALVARLVNAFLETRWLWPRLFTQMTPYAFVLTDPTALALDKDALQLLSRELQLKLFGTGGAGEVTLVLFEGDEMQVHRFANLSQEAVQDLLDGHALEPAFEGALSKVTTTGAASVALDLGEPRWIEAVIGGGPKPMRMPGFDRQYEPVYRGVYFAPDARFVGNIALCKPFGATSARDALIGSTVLPGVPTDEFDAACIESAITAFNRYPVDGLMLVPLNFSSLVRPAGLKRYAEFIERLPEGKKGRLSAAIYETPRDPSFFALSKIRTVLGARFGQIDLHVTDPAFEVEKLAKGAVNSVTLVLPDLDPGGRAAAIRTFMKSREAFKSKQIWPGVSRVTGRTELDLCLAARTPVVSGPAVTDMMSRPLAPIPYGTAGMPVR